MNKINNTFVKSRGYLQRVIGNFYLKINNTFIKSIILLGSGSIFAQLITVIIAPILTRIFTPDELGTYTYVLSVASIFMAVINGRYDMSIVSEKEEKYIYPLIKLSIIIGIAMSIIVTIGYYIYIRFISSKGISYKNTIIFIFLILISYAINNVLVAFNNRNREYKIMTSVYIVRTLFQNIIAVVAGMFKIGVIGLLASYCAGQYLGLNKQAKTIKKYSKDIKKVKLSELKYVLKKHYKQPLFSATGIFLNSFSYSSIIVFLEIIFGISVVGYYSISVRLLGLPLSIISGNISKVFFEEASKEYSNTNQFYQSFKKTFKFQLILAIPMVVVMIFLAPKLCVIFFGQDWILSGKYISILAIMFGFKFVVTSLSPGLIIANKQKAEFILQGVFVIASIASFIITKIMSLSVEYYLILISFTFSVGYVMYLIAIFRYSKKSC